MAWLATVVQNVRTDGADTNGGGFDSAAAGVNRSLQAAAHANGTNLTVDATTNTDVTPDGYTPVSDDVGNQVNISAGAGFTLTYPYTIKSIQSGKWRLDRSPAATSTSGGTWALGGALLSPAISTAYVNAAAVANTTILWKAGTYNCSSTANVAAGRPNPNVAVRIIGYNATPGDLSGASGLWSANMPSLKATSNSMSIFGPSANDCSIENIEADGDSANRTSVAGFNPTANLRIRAVNCRAKACTNRGFGSNGTWYMYFCDCTGHVAAPGIVLAAGFAVGSISRGGTSSANGFQSSGSAAIVFCASSGNGGVGFAIQTPIQCIGCVAHGNTGAGFDLEGFNVTLVNCIAYGNTGYGYSTSTAANGALALLFNCAGGSNTAGNFNSTHVPAVNKINFATPSADPFTNAAARDFSLNNTAGGGAALRALGLGAFPGGATVGYPDIGAAQHQESAAAGGRVQSLTRGLVS